MVTALDGAYHDILPSGLEDGVLEVGAYLPDDSDEILAVLKVQATDETCSVSLRAYLDGHPEHLAAVRSAAYSGGLNVNYPLFTEVTVDAGRKEMEAGIICARAVGASSVLYCVMLLTNFTHIDLPVGKVQFPPEHTCLAAMGKACAGGSVDTELESLVTVKQALLMMDLEDVPPGLSSVRLVIILVLNLALEVYHMDVETAFLNSTLEEDLYVKLPRGLEYQGRTCVKLLKAVYGLKQAGK
eukprot:gene34660-biopygen35159